VPRQNGKGSILEARELTALFIDERRWPTVAARLAVHSAHEAKTSHEGYERLIGLIENCKRLKAKLSGRPRQSEGGEQIRIVGNRRIRFRTRTGGGGRGLSGDLLIFDEAMILAEPMHRAVWPIVTARPNPQIWYTGSAVDQEHMADGVVFSRVRHRGHKGDPDLAYFEWSLDKEHPDEVRPEEAADPEVWWQVNPGLDVRLSRRVIAVEQRSLSPRGFAVERLSVGDWPDPDGAQRIISEEAWRACLDPESVVQDPVCFAVDVAPGRRSAAIGVAGLNTDGKDHVEVIKRFKGVQGVVDTLVELTKRHRHAEVAIDNVGPAAALIPQLEEKKVRVVTVTAGEHAKGCGMIFDGVEQGTLVHLADQSLDAALAGAVKRPLGESWAWSRKNSTVDITPLVAVTLAEWGFRRKRQGSPGVISLNDMAAQEGEPDIDESELPPLDPEDLE
jgi:phage terminase large subunit-like protein